MNESTYQKPQQDIPSVSWAWFHSGSIDLLVSTVILAIGLFFLITNNIEMVSFSTAIFAVVFIIMSRIFTDKVYKNLFRRIPKENSKLSRVELVSEIMLLVILAVFLPVAGVGGLMDKWGVKTVMMLTILLLLLIGAINSIRVKYNYYLIIAGVFCILMIRSFMGDRIASVLPSAWSGARYVLVGLLFGAVSIHRISKFMKRYPEISE
ncbi:MAG: hypothetical protein U1C33_08895 [Candidatus Cloacimonadaceae bacterium]|nr:hypothetical protein [Candidatus Cloacimonadaceae bacterium]